MKITKEDYIKGGKLIHAFIREIDGKFYMPITEGLALNYFRDWESLMFLIKKIESLNFDEFWEYSFMITKYSVYVELINEEGKNKHLQDLARYGTYAGTEKLNATYKMVVHFIKWYNKININTSS